MMDKFLTDLAAHTGAECVRVEHWPSFRLPFRVLLWNQGGEAWNEGEGETVEAAMTAAIAKRKAAQVAA